MNCRICGTEGNSLNPVKYYPKYFMALHKICAEEMSDEPKMNSKQFYLAYWGENWEEVPRSTAKNFYEDYRAFTGTFEEYVDSTRSYTWE